MPKTASKQTPKELRFGVIGCGGMGAGVHTPNMAHVVGAKTVAYCDIVEDKAKALLAKFGGEYTTPDEKDIYADKTLDGVLIQVGPLDHPRMVQSAAKTGKHVFVEKPIAVDLADALETVRVVEKAGVKFIHGTCQRLAPMVKMAKRMCPNPAYSFCQCADTVTHQACHNLDLAVNCFHDAPLATVYASGRQVWGLDQHLAADSFSAVLTFTDDSVHTYIQHGASFNTMLTKYHYQLFGKDRCVYLAKRFKECHLMRDRNTVEKSWGFTGQDMDRDPYGYMGHFDELQELVNCILNKKSGNGSMTVRDAAYILAVEKAILHSIETKDKVDFEAFLEDNDAAFLLEGRG